MVVSLTVQLKHVARLNVEEFSDLTFFFNDLKGQKGLLCVDGNTWHTSAQIKMQ
jgi:hypothetical protein